MAAVLALIMLPLVASIGFFVGVNDLSVRGAMAMLTFAMLGTGMLYGMLRFIRGLEE